MVQQLKGLQAQYDAFDCIRTRSRSNGIAMMPLAGASPQPAIAVVLNGGIEYETVIFSAVRRGAPPTVPGPNTSNPNRLFLGGSQSAPFPCADVGGVKVYVVSGAYVFAIVTPEGLDGDFAIGSMPDGLDPDPDQYIPLAYFNDQLINWNHQTPTIPPSQDGEQNYTPGPLLYQISSEG